MDGSVGGLDIDDYVRVNEGGADVVNNLKSQNLIESIKRIMKNYEDNQEKIKLYLGEEDDKELYQIYNMIKFFRGNE